MSGTAGGDDRAAGRSRSSRPSCPSGTRASASCRRSGPSPPRSARPYELLVVHDMPEDTTVPVVERLAAEIPGLRAHHNTLGPGRAQRDEGGDRRRPGAVRARHDGRRLRRVRRRRPDGRPSPATAPTSSRPAATCAADARSAARASSGSSRGWPASRSTGSPASRSTTPTNNFKLYSRRFLDATPIESEAGFELAIELSVKATLQGRPAGRGSHHLARPDRRREPLPPAEVAAPLPALVPRRVPGPAQPALTAGDRAR